MEILLRCILISMAVYQARLKYSKFFIPRNDTCQCFFFFFVLGVAEKNVTFGGVQKSVEACGGLLGIKLRYIYAIFAARQSHKQIFCIFRLMSVCLVDNHLPFQIFGG